MEKIGQNKHQPPTSLVHSDPQQQSPPKAFARAVAPPPRPRGSHHQQALNAIGITYDSANAYKRYHAEILGDIYPKPNSATGDSIATLDSTASDSEFKTIFREGNKLNSFSLKFLEMPNKLDKFYREHVHYPKKMSLQYSGGYFGAYFEANEIPKESEFYLEWDNSGKISSLEINGNKKIVQNVIVIKKSNKDKEDKVLLEFENEPNSIIFRPGRCCVRWIQMPYPPETKNLNDYTKEKLFGQNGIFTDENNNYDKLIYNILRIYLGEPFRIRNGLTSENICIQHNPENNLTEFQINDLPGEKPEGFKGFTNGTGNRTYNAFIYDSPRYLNGNTQLQVIRELYEATIALLTKFGIYNWTHSEFLKNELVPKIENWYTENRVFDWIKEIRINESGESNASEIKEFLTQVDPTPLLQEITHTSKTVNPHYTKAANAIEKYLSDNSQKENAVLLMGIIGFLVSAKKATDKNIYDADMQSLLERIQNSSLKKLIYQLEKFREFQSNPAAINMRICDIYGKLNANSSYNEWIEVLCRASEEYGGPAGKEAAERCRKHQKENPEMYLSMTKIFQAVQNPDQEKALKNLYDYFGVPRNEDAALAVK